MIRLDVSGPVTAAADDVARLHAVLFDEQAGDRRVAAFRLADLAAQLLDLGARVLGGEPHAAATPRIPAFEGLDRGWYAGPVGWTDATGDGEFCVALRCALVRGTVARCYAGNGIVRGSDPAAELAETEIKLAALLPLLAG